VRSHASNIGNVVPEAVVTFESLDGFEVVRSCGTARGEAAVPRNLLRATFRTIGSFIGFTPIDYLTDAERARRESLAALVSAAEALGANGVIRLRFTVNELGDGSTTVVAIGEALVLNPSPGSV
jgi:uncharacterized protein YbjQ (UPF0145 family)